MSQCSIEIFFCSHDAQKSISILIVKLCFSDVQLAAYCCSIVQYTCAKQIVNVADFVQVNLYVDTLVAVHWIMF